MMYMFVLDEMLCLSTATHSRVHGGEGLCSLSRRGRRQKVLLRVRPHVSSRKVPSTLDT